MPSRLPPHLFLLGAAGLAALLLVPADAERPQITGMAMGDAPPAPASAGLAPVKADSPVTAAAPAVAAVPPPDETAPPAAPVTTLASVAPGDVTPAAEPRYVWVGGAAVNVRAGPSTGTARLFVLQRGARVTVTERAGDWALIVDQGGESGWVHSRYLADTPEAAAATAPKQPTPEVEKRYGRVSRAVPLRAGPSRYAPRLFLLRPGERIAVVETRGRWLRIVLESGASAWIDGRELAR